jgi:hypothetical protein
MRYPRIVLSGAVLAAASTIAAQPLTERVDLTCRMVSGSPDVSNTSDRDIPAGAGINVAIGPSPAPQIVDQVLTAVFPRRAHMIASGGVIIVSNSSTGCVAYATWRVRIAIHPPPQNHN